MNKVQSAYLWRIFLTGAYSSESRNVAALSMSGNSITTILVGDQEFESAKTLSAFALALTLIVITLGLNFFALQIVKKYREQYD